MNIRQPDEILDDFRKALELLTRLAQDQGGQRGPGSQFQRVLFDARMRVHQAGMLLDYFRKAELRAGQIGFLNADSDELRLYGEAFYYFAFRACRALESLTRLEPMLALRFEPEGVRDVRNHLIEHPEKSNGAHVVGWSYACPEGLILNDPDAPDAEDEEFIQRDRGLYPNADEFVAKLLVKLTACPLVNGQQ